jgi:glutathione S-transferase
MNMKLFYSPASPYVRKVMVCAIELGLDSRIERLPSAAHPVTRDETVAQANPIGKVPTMVLADGTALFDSRVICEYLDSVASPPRLFPAAGPQRIRALRDQALGDAILDAALLARYETVLRPAELVWQPWLAGQLRKVSTGVDFIDSECAAYGDRFDIGTLTIACALGYLDFRFPKLDWRAGRGRAAAWFERVGQRASLRDTAPQG